MTLNEYYNFSEDANVNLRYTSFFDEQPDNFPCPSNMSNAFTEQKNILTTIVCNFHFKIIFK